MVSVAVLELQAGAVMRHNSHPWRSRSHADYLNRVAANRVQREQAIYERRCCPPKVQRKGS